MKVPKEVIVVEGRDDTHRLIQVLGPQVKTIETNGSAIEKEVQEQILAAADRFGIIVFTDPDVQGNRIRQIVTNLVPQAKQAHLTRSEAKGKNPKRSLGVEHASTKSIQTALEQVLTVQESEGEMITLSDLIRLKLIGHPDAAKRRDWISDTLRLGKLNGKQLQKKLYLYQIDLGIIEKILKEREESEV